MNLFDLLKPKKARTIKAETLQAVQREWQTIDTLLLSAQPSQIKQALISADKTLDNILRDLYEGNTMAERMRSAKSRFDPAMYDLLWQAHLMRNTLVHESGLEMQQHILIRKISDLRSGVRYLGVNV